MELCQAGHERQTRLIDLPAAQQGRGAGKYRRTKDDISGHGVADKFFILGIIPAEDNKSCVINAEVPSQPQHRGRGNIVTAAFEHILDPGPEKLLGQQAPAPR